MLGKGKNQVRFGVVEKTIDYVGFLPQVPPLEKGDRGIF